VRFADYASGNKQGFVRMADPEAAAKAIKEISENKVKIGDNELQCSLVEGKEEELYWNNIINRPGGKRGRRKPTRKMNKKRRK